MMHRSNFAPAACLLLMFVVGCVGLSSCGGGGSGAGRTLAREITITPPARGAPRAVGSIPAQTLIAGGNASRVNVAPYFMDPENDRLMYSAASDRPGTATASASGSTISLNPVSAGTATVTVTASDGNAHATQSIATTVQEPQTGLTGFRIELLGSETRRGFFCMTPEPAGTQLSGLSVRVAPGRAGRPCCSQVLGDTLCLWFNCSDGYTGDATITATVDAANGQEIEKTLSFTCR